LTAGSVTDPDPDFTIDVPTALDYTFGFDLTADPLAPVNEGYYTDALHSAKILKLTTGAGSSTMVYMNMLSWGATGATIPADPSNWLCELKEVNGQDASAPTITLTYDTSGTHSAAVGKFLIETLPAPISLDFCVINVDGITLGAGKSYAVRFNDGTTWSSINNPEDLLTTEPPAPPEDLLTVPRFYGRDQVPPPYLQIFRNDPIVRRDGRITIDLFNSTANPTTPEAFSDILKQNGTEFTVNLLEDSSGGHPIFIPYPKIVIIGGTSTPVDGSTITDINDPNGLADVTIPQTGGREVGRLSVDVTAPILNLPPPDAEFNTLYFAYKVFKSDGTAEGTGKFEVPAAPVEPQTPIGIVTGGPGWGVNVGGRGVDWSKDDFNTLPSSASINGSTMSTPTPDVLWVYFNGTTRVLDWDEYWGAGAPANNIAMIIQDQDDSSTWSMKVGLSIVGVTATGNYIAMHDVSRNDGAGYYYDWVSAVPGGGILQTGHVYDLILDDLTTGVPDFTYPTPLNVIGNNPNFP
jgi:hypothetical protein